MNDTRILQKIPGAIGRYTFGAFKFNASCDQHAERMKDAYLKNEAKKDKPWQADPLTPRMRLKLEHAEAEKARRAEAAILARPPEKKVTKKKAAK